MMISKPNVLVYFFQMYFLKAFFASVLLVHFFTMFILGYIERRNQDPAKYSNKINHRLTLHFFGAFIFLNVP